MTPLLVTALKHNKEQFEQVLPEKSVIIWSSLDINPYPPPTFGESPF
jgi:hypothetical protein